jgi:hypothetical protein
MCVDHPPGRSRAPNLNSSRTSVNRQPLRQQLRAWATLTGRVGAKFD